MVDRSTRLSAARAAGQGMLSSARMVLSSDITFLLLSEAEPCLGGRAGKHFFHYSVIIMKKCPLVVVPSYFLCLPWNVSELLSGMNTSS